jgi:hypothetical protein
MFAKGASFKRFEMHDVKGKVYKTTSSWDPAGTMTVNRVYPFDCEFEFVVPRGTKLKKFHFEELSFDLEKLDTYKTR